MGASPPYPKNTSAASHHNYELCIMNYELKFLHSVRRKAQPVQELLLFARQQDIIKNKISAYQKTGGDEDENTADGQ